MNSGRTWLLDSHCLEEQSFPPLYSTTSVFFFLELQKMAEKMSWTVADAADYKGFPADRSKTGGWVTAALILGIEIVERLSTMGIAVNLVTYMISIMHMPSSTAANTVTDFMGTSFLLCLLGGFLADSFLGRYKTIGIFASIQTLGTVTLAISTKLPQLRPPPCHANSDSCKQANGFQMGILYLSLYLIALGTGGLKSSVSGFGSDQFDEKDEKEKSQMTYFFNRFFFFISFGTLAAVTVLVYIQDEVSRSLAYGICSVSMIIAIMVFLSGTKRYRYKKSLGSPIVQIFQVIAAAIKKRKMQLPYNVGSLYEDTPEASRIEHTDQFRFLEKAAIVAEGDLETNSCGSPEANPWKLCSLTRVEEVKMMVRLLPVWATTILFWTIYAQMITFSVEQASTMKRNIGSFQIPAGSLTVFFVAAILITLALYDRLIMPLWKKWKGKPGFTNLQRIAIGLLLSVFGMAIASCHDMGQSRAEERLIAGYSKRIVVPKIVLLFGFQCLEYLDCLGTWCAQVNGCWDLSKYFPDIPLDVLRKANGCTFGLGVGKIAKGDPRLKVKGPRLIGFPEFEFDRSCPFCVLGGSSSLPTIDPDLFSFWAHCAFPCLDVRLSKSSNGDPPKTGASKHVDEDPRTEGSISRGDDFPSPEEE
ncbi:hypothetical protein VNO78_23530 [Psophocarpus tetragonolobus]|uniref:Uncharacterized protein n=1 Tax=Psophocarpus tetragonolobus TaxID=3891 RepID=A0AAN9S3P9_PSOTE